MNTSLKHPYITFLVESSWEMFPTYTEFAPRGMREAIAVREGTCAHRSTFIGRTALMDGIPAMRSIYFTANNKPSHYSSILYLDGHWVRVNTDAFPNTYYLNEQTREISPSVIGWAPGSNILLHRVTDKIQAKHVGELVIPEIAMGHFKLADRLEDHLEIALNLEQQKNIQEEAA
jgi:hypothetical protein